MIDFTFHKNNRQKLMNVIPDGLVVLSAFTKMQGGNDYAFKFQQEANFWWLTGINQSDWQLIIDCRQSKSWLVAPTIDDVRRTFDGGLDFDNAKAISCVDSVINSEEASKLLGELSKIHTTVHVIDEPKNKDRLGFTLNPAQHNLRDNLEQIFDNVVSCNLDLAKLRSIKQPVEIEAIKKANSVTIKALKDIKKRIATFKYEYEIEAELTYHFRKSGADGHAFDPIVAGGKNACTLHYGENNSKIKPGDLILLDVGAQVGGYSADISRTYSPGVPSPRQIAVHKSVQDAQKKIIKLLKPGLSIVEYQAEVEKIMYHQLKQLGLLSSPDDCERYFPHGIGHGLGVDTHDSLGGATEFMPGMVVTVEPGIYIPEEGIGVRIEDDILITENGFENLTGKLGTGL